MVGGLVYLLDTNIILELLLEQEHSGDVERLFAEVPAERLFVTDFSLYSIGIILFRNKRSDAFVRVVGDLFLETNVSLIRLDPADMKQVEQAARRFRLDFDDAYQCVAAKKFDLTLLSFDADFDRTERGRKTPAEVLLAQ